MLFKYIYVPHKIDAVHAWLDHLVKSVWCRDAGTFTLDLLHPDLKAVVESIYDAKARKPRGNTGDWLHGPIKSIDRQIRRLTLAQRKQFVDWHVANNKIEEICEGRHDVVPGTYKQVETMSSLLAEDLAKFCKSLYTTVLDLQAVKDRAGTVGEHYESFVKVNTQGKCPYCGISDFHSEHMGKREDYDHFLPKSLYPFNSVNFRNLAPMCHRCNSDFKSRTDPAWRRDPISKRRVGRRPAVRRKAYYAYAPNPPAITIKMTVRPEFMQERDPKYLEIHFSAPGEEEELEAWRDVFGMEKRYKDKCCGQNSGWAWLVEVIEQGNGALGDAALARQLRGEALDRELCAAASRPWADAGFLKKPFLEACADAGLFS